jgi:hypothetical protein
VTEPEPSYTPRTDPEPSLEPRAGDKPPMTFYRVFGRWPADGHEHVEMYDGEFEAIDAARVAEAAGVAHVHVERVVSRTVTRTIEDKHVIYGSPDPWTWLVPDEPREPEPGGTAG